MMKRRTDPKIIEIIRQDFSDMTEEEAISIIVDEFYITRAAAIAAYREAMKSLDALKE